MMGGGGLDPNLKSLEPARLVKTIAYCRDTYRVTTADGKSRAFWERNLRFMTDTSKDGPEKNAPAYHACRHEPVPRRLPQQDQRFRRRAG